MAVFEVAPCDPGGCRQAECEGSGGRWDLETCSCQEYWEDPLVLTLDGKPIHLTDASGGVAFDLTGSGIGKPVAWTQAGSTAAFLVLDLDGDGAITTGAELFGMPVGAPRHQKPSASDNSFTLLAAYDTPALGGNGDAVISAADAVFSRLRLWVDANHDGVSQLAELTTLATAGIVSIDVSCQVTGRRDGNGNFFRYRGTVHLTSGRTVPIWDVFLGTGMTAGDPPDFATGPMPADDDSSFADGGGEESGLGATGDAAVAGTPGAPRLDPPPTTLQVVEYYHLDALGSVRALTNALAQVIARHDFLPFGDELNAQIPPHGGKLFTGQERDFETGLDYFHARQLRVDLGRFTAPDPLTDLAWTDGTLGASNAYSYVQNNPLGFIDPTGAVPTFRSGVIVYLKGPGVSDSWEYVFVAPIGLQAGQRATPGPSVGGAGAGGNAGDDHDKQQRCLTDSLAAFAKDTLVATMPIGAVVAVIQTVANDWSDPVGTGLYVAGTTAGVAGLKNNTTLIKNAASSALRGMGQRAIAKSFAKSVAKFIPVAGEALIAADVIYAFYKATESYKSCMSQ